MLIGYSVTISPTPTKETTNFTYHVEQLNVLSQGSNAAQDRGYHEAQAESEQEGQHAAGKSRLRLGARLALAHVHHADRH